MSYYDYDCSKHLELHIEENRISFYALIMTAMRKADTKNIEKLRSMWPGVWAELYKRYNTPGGVLESDPEELKRKVIEEHS